jgi:AraC-like DNA-binding protein/anti-anti-sigma regulatory factor
MRPSPLLTMEGELVITSARLRDGIVVAARGLVCVSKIPDLQTALADAAGPHERLTIDLSEADVPTAAGVALLLNAVRRADVAAAAVRVVCPPVRFRWALERTGLARRLEIADRVEEPATGEVQRVVPITVRRGIARREPRARTPERRSRLLAEATVAIEVHYADPDLGLDQVARRIATSSRQLQRVFAERAGTTFRAELNAVRMQHAAELLQTTALPVSAIARRVGHRQPAHFANAFRRHHRMSPTAFRRAARPASRAAPDDER